MSKRQSLFQTVEALGITSSQVCLHPLCQSKGLDANAVMALCGNRNGSFGNGWDGIIALIVIAAIFGGNGNGLFGNNNNSTERQMHGCNSA